jgi:hypothetical protein
LVATTEVKPASSSRASTLPKGDAGSEGRGTLPTMVQAFSMVGGATISPWIDFAANSGSVYTVL